MALSKSVILLYTRYFVTKIRTGAEPLERMPSGQVLPQARLQIARKIKPSSSVVQVLALTGSYHGDTLGAMEAQAPSSYTGALQQPWYLFLSSYRSIGACLYESCQRNNVIKCVGENADLESVVCQTGKTQQSCPKLFNPVY
jgi:hypothetical protein